MLEVRALSFDYEDTPLLNQIDFIVQPGQLLHLKGRNGVGKTTLLRLLATLLQPNAGDILFEQQSIQTDLAAYRQQLCYVSDKSGLNTRLSIRENDQFALNGSQQPKTLAAQLAAFHLEGVADKPCGQLSLGQRRRASLLRLMRTPAKLWLLDEPFSALDKPSRRVLLQLITKQLQNQGCVVLTSHQALPDAEFHVMEYALS